MGVNLSVVPDDEMLANVRRLSNRQFSSSVLKELQESFVHPILLGNHPMLIVL